ncbi:hypothetical protein HAX54_038679 [Datura stramonium]|uniref:Uncharacterized protein n=1 Tax=Datura stramonium TaxID=4076 RepID=A0ABS8VMI2_DATST|nr:hypothetical protein [Datura stramonium]
MLNIWFWGFSKASDFPSSLSVLQQFANTAVSDVHTTAPDFPSKADNEAEFEANSFINNLRGLSHCLHWPELASTAPICSEIDTCESLPLIWHEGDNPDLLGSQHDIQKSTVLETSKWTKLVMGNACSTFRINVTGFKHEIFDLVMRIDQKRLDQSKKRENLTVKAKGREKEKLKFKT